MQHGINFERGHLREAWALVWQAVPVGVRLHKLDIPQGVASAHRFKGARILCCWGLKNDASGDSSGVWALYRRIDVAYETESESRVVTAINPVRETDATRQMHSRFVLDFLNESVPRVSPELKPE